MINNLDIEAVDEKEKVIKDTIIAALRDLGESYHTYGIMTKKNDPEVVRMARATLAKCFLDDSASLGVKKEIVKILKDIDPILLSQLLLRSKKLLNNPDGTISFAVVKNLRALENNGKVTSSSIKAEEKVVRQAAWIPAFAGMTKIGHFATGPYYCIANCY